jgi:iron(III) transport system ATP-binding protein
MSTTSKAELLEVSGLAVHFGEVHAVDGADLAVHDGEIVALLGPSGCGKTTLLRAIAGFERVAAGRIELGGETLEGPGRSVPAHRRPVGLVFQDYALFPHRTVAGNVAYGLGASPWAFGSGRAARKARVSALLELAGLEGLEDRYPHQLSGGQQQRVALLRSLAPRPRIVLLDEPFSNLDPMRRQEMRTQVAALLRAEGVSAILVTHDRADALALADRVAVMSSGRILQCDTSDAVYFGPNSPEVAQMLGDVQYVEAEVREGRAETPVGLVRVAGPVMDGPARLLLRPEWIIPCPGGAECEVGGRDAEGATTRVRMRFADGSRLEMLTPSGWAPEPGAHLQAGVRVPLPSFGA